MRSAGGASEAGAKTKGNKTMRGQAHVAMRDVQSAREAMRALQGFGLCGGGGREREGMVCSRPPCVFVVPGRNEGKGLTVCVVRM